jgi:hypothetical protein
MVPTALAYVDSFNAAVDVVARERRYIGFCRGSVSREHQGVRPSRHPRARASRRWPLRGQLRGGLVTSSCGNPHEGFRHVGRLGWGLLPWLPRPGAGEAIGPSDDCWQVGIERVELDVRIK